MFGVCKNVSAVTREDLWVSSKLNNPYHDPADVGKALRKTLTDLKVDYVIIFYLISQSKVSSV